MRTLACIVLLAALGAVVGLALASKEVASQGYFHAELWRTGLWTAARGGWLGALAGAAAGALLLLLLASWSALLQVRVRQPQSAPGSAPLSLPACPPWVARAALMGRFPRVLSGVVLAGVVALCLAGWVVNTAARAAAKERGRSVILIGLDTVREDSTSLLSEGQHERDLTPNLRELAARGAVFSHAISQASWTLPAFASIFTGLYPEEHGAEKGWQVLAPSQLTLAELLREAGYLTIGISSGIYVTRAAGMTQGFELFDESQALDEETISSVEVTDRAIRLLRAHRDQPLFLFLHYFDPHWMYRDHQQYHFADEYQGPLQDLCCSLTHDEFERHAAAACSRPGQPLLDAQELHYLRQLHHEEIAFTDAHIGRLLREVRNLGLQDNTLIVVVSDHGEAFLEHHHLFHGKTLYQELVHVPLAIAGPEVPAGSSHAGPVETRALFATILEFLGVKAPGGSSTASLLRIPPGRQILARSAICFDVGGNRQGKAGPALEVWTTCIQDARWKLIKEHVHNRAALFDLTQEPAETRDCSAEHPEQRRRLERELHRLDAAARRRAPAARVPEADEHFKRKLRALGYL
ncbi:MAG: sulfatase [Armatimonadota bacterium]|nr:MAG: sulfatase [Armatimonadota bacterium]